MTRFKAFIPKCFRSIVNLCQEFNQKATRGIEGTYLNETPYCDTGSKLDFQTRVTSQEVVACNLQEMKAEIALLPTKHHRVSYLDFCFFFSFCPFGSEHNK